MNIVLSYTEAEFPLKCKNALTVSAQAELLSSTDGSRPRNESQENLTGFRTICCQTLTDFNHSWRTPMNPEHSNISVHVNSYISFESKYILRRDHFEQTLEQHVQFCTKHECCWKNCQLWRWGIMQNKDQTLKTATNFAKDTMRATQAAWF